EPAKVPNERTGYFALVDGGVFANNPAMCAYVDALQTAPPGADILLVSLGTGALTRHYEYEKVKGWGLLTWARPLIDVFFDGQSRTADYELAQLLRLGQDGLDRYYRFQCPLEHAMDDLDDATPSNVHMLKVAAESLVHDRSADIDVLCKQLMP